MTLTKKKMVREIGRRTRLTNREVQLMLETLIEVWTESLVAGERIEIENFFVLEVKTIDRGKQSGVLNDSVAPRYITRITLKASRKLRSAIAHPP